MAEISGRGAIISGQGYMHTCQDKGVFLVPATGPSPTDAQALKTARHADCDSEGHFRFSDVANGKYHVVASIHWLVRWQHNGHDLRQVVDVTGPENRFVELTQDLRPTSRN